MTMTPDPQDGSQKIGADKIILGVLAVLLIGTFMYLSSQRQQALRNSAIGLDGLQVWLSQDESDVQSFTGGWPLNVDDIGLQIMPLYDTQLNKDRERPTTTEELIFQQDEYDLATFQILEKAEMVPTMMVLPKWRSGVRLTALAHPELLVDKARVSAIVAGVISGRDATISRVGTAYTGFTYAASDGARMSAEIYAAQTLTAPECHPVIGTQSAMLLAQCPVRNGYIFILSDPDLLNNHGLRLGDNAFIIRDWVTMVAADQRVIIDYTRENWLTEDVTREQRDRTWDDLKRFSAPPFTLMWAGLALAVLLLIWRSGVRFGPILGGPANISASKQMAIAARARLMRLSNRDGSLAVEYSKARLATTATTIFGAANARQFSQPETFLAYVQRRHPTHVRQMTEALNVIQSLPPNIPASQAMASIADFDRILEIIKNDT